MKKGNSGSGVAAADAENAIPPVASAPRTAAARREVDLNAFEHGPSPVPNARALFDASLHQGLAGKGFRAVASRRQNGFVGLGNCFVLVSQ
jgi:hypothetical protein